MYKVELPVRYILATNEVCSLSDWDFNTVKVDLSESCSLNFKASEFSMTIDNNEIVSLSENGNVYLRSDKELPSEPSEPSEPSDPAEPKLPDSSDDSVFRHNWDTYKTSTVSSFTVKTSLDIKFTGENQGFFHKNRPITNWYR